MKLKSRKIKEYSRKIINGGKVPIMTANRIGHIIEEPYQAYTDGRPPVYKYMFVPHSEKLRIAIHKEAYRNGWDGCHWDDPLLLDVDDGELRKWEEENNY